MFFLFFLFIDTESYSEREKLIGESTVSSALSGKDTESPSEEEGDSSCCFGQKEEEKQKKSDEERGVRRKHASHPRIQPSRWTSVLFCSVREDFLSPPRREDKTYEKDTEREERSHGGERQNRQNTNTDSSSWERERHRKAEQNISARRHTHSHNTNCCKTAWAGLKGRRRDSCIGVVVVERKAGRKVGCFFLGWMNLRIPSSYMKEEGNTFRQWTDDWLFLLSPHPFLTLFLLLSVLLLRRHPVGKSATSIQNILSLCILFLFPPQSFAVRKQ